MTDAPFGAVSIAKEFGTSQEEDTPANDPFGLFVFTVTSGEERTDFGLVCIHVSQPVFAGLGIVAAVDAPGLAVLQMILKFCEQPV